VLETRQKMGEGGGCSGKSSVSFSPREEHGSGQIERRVAVLEKSGTLPSGQRKPFFEERTRWAISRANTVVFPATDREGAETNGCKDAAVA